MPLPLVKYTEWFLSGICLFLILDVYQYFKFLNDTFFFLSYESIQTNTACGSYKFCIQVDSLYYDKLKCAVFVCTMNNCKYFYNFAIVIDKIHHDLQPLAFILSFYEEIVKNSSNFKEL